ncbi:sodium ABC transporter [Clostridium botulinum]|uniref:ABC transporter permease n=1 Tax=Clostridium botulinum TaxID=1491 RepID=UPI000464B2B6|nr:ABC transporter permease [Clostridium botulinum]NFK35002.1 ABC transporter permease [Clostridium botulinum H04402 065]APQ71926.1 ABC-2 type transporter family protein [Clostridium botulinum]AUM88224.1 sodium ABC transporter [Clostridium botulinum]AUN10739.1 sodium ABC transporter [Clostridium botulinum]AUN18150.1 sodium ABC transporter [Clostridium botulinum]
MKNIVAVVLKKELLDLFRDKKTLILSILIPIILLPIMSFAIGKMAKSDSDKVQNNLKIAIVDQGNSSFSKFIKSHKNVKVMDSKNIDKDIKDGDVYLQIKIPKGFDENISKDSNEKIELKYDNSSNDAMTAVSMIKNYIDEYSKQIVAERLERKDIDQSILTPINIVDNVVGDKDDGFGKIMASMMIPLLLMLYSATSTIGAAVDLGAGEKERGTLEPLLTTKAGRTSLLVGKFLAITVMGILMSCAYLIGILITMNQPNGMFGDAGLNLGPATLVLIMILPILYTMVFGALQLAISIYAKSFKEAQTYLSPITIIAMVLIYMVMMKDPKNIGMLYFNIPLTNGVCLMKEFLAGIYNHTHIAITFGWIIVYIVASISFARYMFSKEEVIFRT